MLPKIVVGVINGGCGSSSSGPKRTKDRSCVRDLREREGVPDGLLDCGRFYAGRCGRGSGRVSEWNCTEDTKGGRVIWYRDMQSIAAMDIN